MLNYIIRRILLIIPVLCIMALITFFITYVLPGDPVRLILGDFATEDQIRELQNYANMLKEQMKQIQDQIDQLKKAK